MLACPPAELTAYDVLENYDGATRRLQAAGSVGAICFRLAEEVRGLTGYDRVKIYRFAPDSHGEVIAEANSGRLPSYLGLHFPASDIPVQARTLYTRNPERLIPDINYTPVPMVSLRPEPIDLSGAMLRSVSPVHLAYLRNMQVESSMSISILRRGRLWGLIACHNHAPHDVSPEIRQGCVLLAQLAAWQIGVAEETDNVRRGAGVQAVESMLLKESTAGSDYRDTLLANGDVLLDLLQASGLALCHGTSVTTIERTLEEDELRALLDWLAARSSSVFVTDFLSAEFSGAASRDAAAGILAVSLGGSARNCMVWFRPEIARTVLWGGNPGKPVDAQDGENRLSPRSSFAAWTEIVQGHSRPWSVRILLVDDSAAYLEEFAMLLAESGVTCSALDFAASPAEGARLLNAQIHDVYIVDYRMPAEDGLTLVRNARRSGNSKPMIVLTGYDTPQVDRAAEEAGANDYLRKGGFTADALGRAIRYARRNAAAIRAAEVSAEEAREADRRFLLAQEAADIGIWDWNIRDNIFDGRTASI